MTDIIEKTKVAVLGIQMYAGTLAEVVTHVIETCADGARSSTGLSAPPARTGL